MLKLKKFVLPLFLAASMLISIPVYAIDSVYVGTWDLYGSGPSNSFIDVKSNASDCLYNNVNSDDIGYFRGIPKALGINTATGNTVANFTSYTRLSGYGYSYYVFTNVNENVYSGFRTQLKLVFLVDYYEIPENGYTYRLYK